MTREEAIEIINCYDIGFYDLSGEKISAYKLADAFDMAIEALQTEVVRCGECRHKYMKDFDMFCPHMVGIIKPNMHCSYGEREGE